MLGKNVLITGGTSGLGFKLSQKCLQRGAFVHIIGRNLKALDELINRYPGKVKVTKLDLSDRDSIILFAEELSEESYDLLINNAGFGFFKSFVNHSDEELLNIIDVNYTNTLLLTKKMLPKMNAGSTIVTITSQAARVTTPYSAVYASSKSGLYAAINAMRMEMPHIHFMTVNPGPINTPFISKADESGTFNDLSSMVQLDSEQLAEGIINRLSKKKTEYNLPVWMHESLKIYQLAPRLLERIAQPLFMTKKK